MKKLLVSLCTVAVAACAHHSRDAEEPSEQYNTSTDDTDVAPRDLTPEVAPNPPPISPPDSPLPPPSTPQSNVDEASESSAENSDNVRAARQATANSASIGPLSGDEPNHAASATRHSIEGAENTGINKRDRGGETLTPIDQSNGSRDLEITQSIRKAVVADSDLSFNAKNVKVITIDGKVTLRGPVNSVQERTSIATIARQTTGVVAVDDQLEVKP